MQLRPSGALLVLATLVVAAPARADEAPPPSYFSCQGKKAGDACQGDDGPGTCFADKCSRLDYSQGTPPRSVESDCLKCRSSSPPVPADAPVADAPKPDQPPATVTAGSAPTAAPAAKSGCRVDADAGAAPLLLLAALVAFRRRRR